MMMRRQLSRALARLSRRADPSRDFIASLHKRLEDTGYLAPAVRRAPVWKLCGAGLLALLLVFIGTGSYAYASDDVLPDHPLYPLRQTIEQAELNLSPMVTHAPKEKIQAKILARRLKEIKIIREKKHALPTDQKKNVLKDVRDGRATLERASSTSMFLPVLLHEAKDVADAYEREDATATPPMIEPAPVIPAATGTAPSPGRHDSPAKPHNPRRAFESFQHLR